MDATEEKFHFDYSPWQRTEKKVATLKTLSNKPTPAQSPLLRSLKYRPSFNALTDSAVSTPDTLFPDLRKECSSLCRHGASPKTPEVLLPEKRKAKDGSIALLKLLIKERKDVLEANKQRFEKLIKENIKLKDEISSFEAQNHVEVKDLLSKYKKYQGALSVLNTTHVTTLQEEEVELKKTQEKIKNMLQVMKSDCEDLDVEIEREKHALKVLHNYKEKEYPDKLEQMKRLQHEIDLCEGDFLAAISQLENIATVERENYQQNADDAQSDMISRLAESTLQTLDGSIKDMARQNIYIKQEIDFHRAEFDKHQTEIDQLEQDIKFLKEEENTIRMKRKYPEKFLVKCLPDTEFDLRIEEQRYLPL